MGSPYLILDPVTIGSYGCLSTKWKHSLNQQGVWTSFVHPNPQNYPSGHPNLSVINLIKSQFHAHN